jgi:hypothetical protein
LTMINSFILRINDSIFLFALFIAFLMIIAFVSCLSRSRIFWYEFSFFELKVFFF